MTDSFSPDGVVYRRDDPYRPNPTSMLWNIGPPECVLSPPDVEPTVRDMLPPSGSMRGFVEWSHMTSDAPSIYALAGWLTAVSTALPLDVKVMGPGGVPVRPNLFTMITGPAGNGRKTFTINRLRSYMHAKFAGRILPNPGSTAGLALALVELESLFPGIIIDSDLSRFLQASQGFGYLANLKQALNTAFDAEPISDKIRKEDVRVTTYSLSFLAGVNREQLEQFADPLDFTGGFLSRWLMIDATRARYLPPTGTGLSNDTIARGEAYFTEELGKRQMVPPGIYTFSRDAGKLADLWSQRTEAYQTHLVTQYGRLAERYRSLYGRVPMLLVRLATLYAVDRWTDAPMVRRMIEVEDVTRAISLLSYHLYSAHGIYDFVEPNRDMRDRRKLLEVIPFWTPTSPGVTEGEICRVARMLRRQTAPILETLVLEGTVLKNVGTGNGYLYARTTTTKTINAPKREEMIGPVVRPAKVGKKTAVWELRMDGTMAVDGPDGE